MGFLRLFDMDFSFLSEIGLTQNESKIYSALLKLGSAPSGRITYETGLHRSRVYEGLNRLVEKGLVSFVKKGNVTFFEASAVDKILDYLEDEKTKIEEKKNRVEKILPELEKFRESKPRAEAHVLQGVEGFKSMRRDVLKNANGEHLLIGAISRENEVMPNFFLWFTKQRVKNKIRQRILHKESARENAMTRAPLVQTRYLPSEIDNPAVINIYGDRVAQVLWKDDYPLVFLLINQDIADSYREYFELLWKTGNK